MSEARIAFYGQVAKVFHDDSRQICVEGAVRSSKTTVCLVKMLARRQKYPGSYGLIGRFSDDDTHKLLKPIWRHWCLKAGVRLQWSSEEGYDELDNGSRVYITGLKCVHPDTKILTSDLRWVKASTLKEGDELIGVEEEVAPGHKRRHLLPTIVTAVQHQSLPSVRVTTTRGATIVSEDHPFLVFKKYGKASTSQPKSKWKEAAKLRIGDRIRFVSEPWESDDTRAGGWLAGIADGEGSLARGADSPKGFDLSIAQSEGPLIDPITRALQSFGFKFRTASHLHANKQRYSWYLCGAEPILRFLGIIRPIRLLSRFSEYLSVGGPLPDNGGAEVLSIESVGIQPTVGFSTTLRTFIGDGFVSHNTQDQTNPFRKFRGLTLSDVYIDQAEELPHEVYQELVLRLSQVGFPHQIVLSPQTVGEDHWIAKEFPHDRPLKPNRAYYPLSTHDNAHNLPPNYIAEMEEAHPPGTPIHSTLILGQRGAQILGDPVYGTPADGSRKGAFLRSRHEGPCAYDKRLRLEVGLDFGKHHPCIVARQVGVVGQVRYLGGILGQNLHLDPFLTAVLQLLAQWFPDPVDTVWCCDPAGVSNPVGLDMGKTLRAHGIQARFKEDSNSPAARVALIDRIAAQMRGRDLNGDEALRVSSDEAHWIRLSEHGSVVHRMVASAFESGYVWDPHMVSVGSKQMRKPKKDGWHEHPMNVVEYLEANFGSLPAFVAEKPVEPYKPKSAYL
jgi:hypothetical protein